MSDLDHEATCAGVLWEAALGPLLTDEQVCERLRVVSSERLDELVSAGELIALPRRDGSQAYPEFQFYGDGPLSALAAAHRILVEDGKLSPWTAAAWLVAEHHALGGLRPREAVIVWGNGAGVVLDAAAKDAARAAQ